MKSSSLIILAVLAAVCVLGAVAQRDTESAEWKYQKAAAAAEKEAEGQLSEIQKLTFYELLNIPRDAEVSLIKKTFRRMSLKIHPDKATTAEERKIRELTYPRYVLANDVLTNAMKRRSYDHLLDIGRHPKITDYDIDNAWDDKRKLWIDELGWAPLEDWHSLLIIILVTAAGFGYPFYNQYKANQLSKEKKERDRVAHLKLIKAKAAANADNVKAEIALAQAQIEASKRPQSPTNSTTDSGANPYAKDIAERKSAEKARVAAEAKEAREKAQAKEQKEAERIAKVKATIELVANTLTRYRKKNGGRIVDRLKRDREAAAATSGGSSTPSYQEVIFSTAIAAEDITALCSKLHVQKLQSMLQSASSAMGSTPAALTAALGNATGANAIADALTEEQYKRTISVILIHLAEVFKGKYPDPIELAKRPS